MFTPIAIVGLLASSALLVRADPDPNQPGPGDVFNQGAQCPIAWDADSTGTWKVMNIELMTGDNFNMVHLTTVATVDGTNPASNTFSWPCPAVDINSAIYFYQFTSPASKNTMWTTRFAIASSTGTTTPPPESKQPDGKAIPWGKGSLTNGADAKPAPAGVTTAAVTGTALGGNSTVASTSLTASASTSSAASSSSSSSSSSTSSGSTSAAAGATKTATKAPSTSAAGTTSAVGSTNSDTPSSNSAAGTFSASGRIYVALGVAAIGLSSLW